ncbi:MAG: hypothetical protein LBV47_02860 [Bacteroidales bacterium]|jgi:hypothetical protein|nr:hypothetical protein [Bacteroidales bacterium]
MSKKISISAIRNWCISTGLFVRPAKILPGKWEVFEFYYEQYDNNLIHYNESRINAERLFYEIDFAENKIFKHKTNLLVPLISKIKDGNWRISRNFVTIVNPDRLGCNVKFQFAIDKGVLKLLKKDLSGKIEFFGFFRSSK